MCQFTFAARATRFATNEQLGLGHVESESKGETGHGNDSERNEDRNTRFGFTSRTLSVRCFAKREQRLSLVVGHVLSMRSVVVSFQLNLGAEMLFAKETCENAD
jgi:hypothetical protein